MTRAHLLWHTVRFLRPEQVASRVRLRAKMLARQTWPDLAATAYQRSVARLDLQPPSEAWPALRAAHHWSTSPEVADAITASALNAVAGRFRFLGVESQAQRPIDWQAKEMSQLWRYHLHYCRFLIDVATTGAGGWPVITSLMREWIDANALGRTRDAWHPFVVSERIVSWMFAIQIARPVGVPIDPAVLESLRIQSLFIARNLETDVGGNHLLKNLKAMAIAGCFWQGAAAIGWRERFADHFSNELCAQLLSDGAHYERSPMYHLLVLADALEVIAVLQAAQHPVPARLRDATFAMVAYLPRMTHADGAIALFNDSVLDEAPSPSSLASMAEALLGTQPARNVLGSCVNAGPDGGLVTITASGGRGRLVIDVGPACPDDLPAHAHADIFSFELTLDRERLIVDSGVGEYQAGPWREYYRSTRAHNTVAVDGADQIECWGSFRVARRARIQDRHEFAGEFVRGITARHDGYGRLKEPVAVCRTTMVLDDKAWLIVDELTGEGQHWWESFIHAAPGVSIAVAEGNRAQLTSASHTAALQWFGPLSAQVVRGASSPRQGWYAPSFGTHLPIDVLACGGAGTLPSTFGYIIAPSLRPSDLDIEPIGERMLRIRLGASQYLVESRQRDVRVTPARS